MAALSKTPPAEVLHTPPRAPLLLGSDFTGYGTDSLACYYLGLSYKVVFVAETNALEDALRKALEDHVTGNKPGEARRCPDEAHQERSGLRRIHARACWCPFFCLKLFQIPVACLLPCMLHLALNHLKIHAVDYYNDHLFYQLR